MPSRAELVRRYGCGDRGYDRWNAIGREVGDMPPWADGAGAMVAWVRRHERKMPSWLARAAVTTGKAPAPVSRVVVPRAAGMTPLEILDGLIADTEARIADARELRADSAVLASFGKDYTNLLDRRKAMELAQRAEDDGLVLRAGVIEVVNTLHSAIPDRIEGALLAAQAEAEAALALGKWAEFCERFRMHTLNDLAAASFGVAIAAI